MNTLLTITGPSCTGKSTLEKKIRDTFKLEKITSFTTRQPRAGEVNGQDYYFLTKEEIEELNRKGEIAELIKFGENYYGILGAEISNKLALNHTIAVVEPNGVKQLSIYCKDNNFKHVSAYITNPPAVLTTRFLKRFKEDIKASTIDYSTRLIKMLKEEQEWMFAHKYDMLFTYFDATNDNVVMQQIYSEVVLR